MFHCCSRQPMALPVFFIMLMLAACQSPPPVMQATGEGAAVHRRGVIACVHPVAAAAATDAYEKGGNAVDAAIAAALTLGVVDGHNSGIGGGCFVLIRKSDGTLIAIDGRETAPAAATADMYLRNGKADTTLSQTGALAIGIPGAVAAYDHALRDAGRLTLADLLRPAADVAERGFILDAPHAARLRNSAATLARFEGSRGNLIAPDGKPWPKGHLLRQPELAKTYRNIATQGIAYFYGGPFAQSVETWMKKNNGLVTARDFADYRIRQRQPLIATYRGFTIVTFPPPSSGGVHLLQMLNILEQADITAMDRVDRPGRLHLTAEAMKLAFADRAYWLGDPDFAAVPRGLVDKSYAARLYAQIQPDRVLSVDAHGEPDPGSGHFGKHTTHIAAADVEGNWVAITATVNTSFGSKVVIPGTGVVMNNQMDDFALQPNIANAFGLLGAQANSVAPGKRPLSSMTPTIVLRDGQPVLTLGAAGGPTIINAVFTTLVGYADLGLSPAAAVAAPRLHHQWRPDELRLETSHDPADIAKLRERGHQVRQVSHIAVLQAIGVDAGGVWQAASDPRVTAE